MIREVKESQAKSKEAMADAARLAGELRQEQDGHMNAERQRKNLNNQVISLQRRLEEVEETAVKAGKRIVQNWKNA